MKRNIFFLFSATLILVLSSCGSQSSNYDSTVNGEYSSKTGWSYNDPAQGNFVVKDNFQQETGPGLVLIEGGTFVMGRTSDDVLYNWNNTPRRVTVDSYYIDQTEVSNLDYREYIHWLRTVYSDHPEMYVNALPDTLSWRENKLSYNDPYVNDYFRHPSFNTFPVVGVSWEQASDYCEWRSDRVNEFILAQNGYLPDSLGKTKFSTAAYLAGKFEVNMNVDAKDKDDAVKERVTMEDGFILPKYRLPTEAEWEYAARGIISPQDQEIVLGNRNYPWEGNNVRYSDPKKRGLMQANFKRGKGDMMGVAGALNDGGSVPLPVDSYEPNDFGLYNMAGNVNEWVLDVYRVLSNDDVDDFRPYRGNEFITPKNKDILPYSFVERLQGVAIDTAKYVIEDYRNFRDGDALTLLGQQDENVSSTESMYKEDHSSVSDVTRVFKGGSWRDRAYWLQPGTRRFLAQDKATNDIGFRCAMNRVGNPQGF